MASTTRNWVAKPILGKEFTEDPLLQDFYVGILKERRNTSVAIQSITAILPGSSHLKRCAGNKLLLASPDASQLQTESAEGSTGSESPRLLTEDELKRHLRDKGFDLSLLEDKFELVKVPAKPARTKEQAQRVSKVWPVNFHPDPLTESLIDGSIFDEDQLRAIESYMTVAIEATRLEAVGNNECNGSALIVDPQDGRILAVAAARINEHPLWHAAMLAIDLIAKLHGGGAWDLENVDRNHWYRCNEDNPPKTIATPDSIDVNAPSQQIDDTEENYERRAEDIKRKYQEEAPIFYPKSLSALRLPKSESLEPRSKKRGRRNNGTSTTNTDTRTEASNTEKIGPYLCSGYTVFLLMEPCPMCAMALLHSRVGRIFYGVANPSTGILGSNGILHALPGLNHRYRVWSGVLDRECQDALSKIEDRRLG